MHLSGQKVLMLCFCVLEFFLFYFVWFFVCWQCRLECQEHMAVNNHLPALMALEVVAFACSQCLAFFPDQITCHAHTSRLQHNQPILPFKGKSADISPCKPVFPSFHR